MATFDFITAPEFRRSLEADYGEMTRCIAGKAWKGVHVLAGSIVEALLIDYLVSTPKPGRKPSDPLTCDLNQAVVLCRAEGVLSDRSADLCSVVRSYRNLIHPGRMIRLSEEAPNNTSSTIAVALVDLIIAEVAEKRRSSAGLTAEQLMSKISRDEGALVILHHLLAEVASGEKERFLKDLLPRAYFEIPMLDDGFGNGDFDRATQSRYARAFRTVAESLDDEPRRRLLSEFVRILREEDGSYVREYSQAFVKPEDLQFLVEQQRPIVKAHLLGRVGSMHDGDSLRMLSGVGPYLEADDVVKWLDPIVRTLTSKGTTEELRERARQAILSECLRTNPDVDEGIQNRLDQWIKTFERSGSLDATEKIESLRTLKTDLAIPF